MSRGILAVACLSVALVGTGVAQHKHEMDQQVDMSRAPLLKGVGEIDHPVSTKNPRAQKFFNQGIALIYAFNHLEAERAFVQAQQLDPKLAMAWWGQALALAPNINDPMTPDRAEKAYAAIQIAIKKVNKKTPAVERDYIMTLAKRYSPDKNADRSALDVTYAKAMGELAKKYPDDPDAQTFYASALMETMPWDYYLPNGDPKPEIVIVQQTLEATMKRWPNHTGANHLYIHAVEASSTPDRGSVSADKLGALAPAAGHLVHMPSHIYLRTGRWEDAAAVNRKAILADEDYISQCRAQGIYPVAYYPHNLHMGSFAASMQGGSTEAITLANKMNAKVPPEIDEALPFWGNIVTSMPVLAMVRFGKWDDVLKYQEPPAKLMVADAIWHYGRGLALIRTGTAADADAELAAIKKISGDPALNEMKMGNNDGVKLVAIAENALAGEIAASRKDYPNAVEALTRSVAAQDSLHYNEPEDWYLPMRHALGAVLLDAGRPVEAEQVYRKDLEQHRQNGWALFGLAKSLREQGKNDEAEKVEAQFATAWMHADVKIAASSY